MTRLLTTGFETGDVNEAGTSTVGANTTHTVVGSVPTPRAAAFCFKIACTASTFSISNKIFLLAAPKTEVWVRWAIYIHPVAAMSGEWGLAQMQDAVGGAQGTVTWDFSSAQVRLRAGSAAGTLLGTGGTALPVDSWHVLEWRTQITSATVGVSEVWLDGNRIINFSGDNTASTTLNVQSVLLGTTNTPAGTATGAYVAYDDLAINDVAGTLNNGKPGDGRVVLLSPNGAGTTTQFVRGGTDTGANFSQVNELPPSMAQYVGSNTVGNRDLYTLSDVAVAVQSINVVEAVLLAQNSDAGGGSIAPTIKSGATTNEATPIGLTTSAGYVTGRWETDPNTAAAWTIAAVNAAEAGATVR